MSCEELLESNEVHILYWGVLLVALMLIVWYLSSICGCTERFAPIAYTAGSGMRIRDSKFSQPTTPNNSNL